MGASASKSTTIVQTRIINELVNEFKLKCKASASSVVNVKIRSTTGDINISDLDIISSAKVNMTCLMNNDTISEIDSSLRGKIEASSLSTSEAFGGIATNSNTTIRQTTIKNFMKNSFEQVMVSESNSAINFELDNDDGGDINLNGTNIISTAGTVSDAILKNLERKKIKTEDEVDVVTTTETTSKGIFSLSMIWMILLGGGALVVIYLIFFS